MPSIPNLVLRGLEVCPLPQLFSLPTFPRCNLQIRPQPKLTPPLSSLTDLLRDPHPRPIRAPRRLPSLRRRPLLYKLQCLPGHMADGRCALGPGGGIRVRAGRGGDGGAGCAERAVCVCGRCGGSYLAFFLCPSVTLCIHPSIHPSRTFSFSRALRPQIPTAYPTH